MFVVSVAVPVPLRRLFDYVSECSLVVGGRVSVPFGSRELVGVVIEQREANDDDTELKPVSAKLDDEPLLPQALFELCQWLSQYYQHPLGEVWHTALPVLLRKGESAEAEPEPWVELAPDVTAPDIESLARARKQQACAQALLDGAQPLAELKQQFGARIVDALKQRDWLVCADAPKSARWYQSLNVAKPPTPNKEQALAIATINAQHGRFAPFLLEGVTGSGKTEVYLQAIEACLQKGLQVLILVPEIGLTPQTVERFATRFGIKVGVLHSQLNDRQRLAVWQQARNNELGIVIGTRSAIFTPLAKPGMLIVDEEHDESYKQQDGLRYHARDFAVMRARKEQMPIVLGSATPSLETLNNALEKRYAHLHLTARATGASATQLQLMDLRDSAMHSGIAEPVLKVMRSHLAQGNQVLVFLNRRGYAPALLCHHCGESVDCKRCERPYTVHHHQRSLQCHHCGGRRPMPHSCPSCSTADLQIAGFGTERLEEGLAQLFPQYKQVRIDSDTIRGKDKLTDQLSAINNREYQLLIGTQILAKGHHFPHVTLVVVIDCDGALMSADFRAPERLAQLMTQLAGRAGRAHKPGEMWLQTHNPGHPLLQDWVHNGYAHFARHALLERKYAALPPYTVQTAWRAEAHDANQAFELLDGLSQYLQQQQANMNGHCVVIGPLPALIEKRQGRYRFILVVRAKERRTLHQLSALGLHYLEHNRAARKVRWSLDVDALDLS